jgi:hypothetical protein
MIPEIRQALRSILSSRHDDKSSVDLEGCLSSRQMNSQVFEDVEIGFGERGIQVFIPANAILVQVLCPIPILLNPQRTKDV